ncbi:MAG: cation:proton antiporter subunit C [Bacillota bacterium]|nr:cation:proton antiporter subunit C [Bacillota bacterium]MDW7683100.1 cation:proton antiporter subunit C [Bacillota bacterium]
MNTTANILQNYPYFVSVVLFCIGIYAILSRTNLMKKVIGINIMGSAIFLLLISAANIRGGTAPISHGHGLPEGTVYVNPLPAALVLTGIVVSLSITSFALSIVVKLNEFYGTIESDEILEIRSQD